MPGDWIKWMKGLTRRREVLAVAQALQMDVRVVACACMEFWEWADDETTNGFIAGLTTDSIDSLLGISGFGSALHAVGWLEIRNGGILLPRWERHNNQSAKARALSNGRQSRKRTCNGDCEDVSRAQRDVSVTRTEQNSSFVSSLGERATEKKWEFDIPAVAKLRSTAVEHVSILCGFHRHASQECPEAISPDESGLRFVIACAQHAKREKKSSALGLFRWLISNPSKAKIDADDTISAGALLDQYRSRLRDMAKAGANITEEQMPSCDDPSLYRRTLFTPERR